MFKILRLLYTLFIVLALPLIFGRLLVRSLRLPAYRKRLLERLGIYANFKVEPNGLCIHAVSVGEVVAAIPLVEAIQHKYPALPVTITTTTPTGSQRVQQSFGNSVAHIYLPYDIPLFLNRLIKALQPCCLIIMETELWPNLLQQCTNSNIPVVIANGRISDRSLRGYMRFRWFIKQILQQVSFVAAQSQMDANRFIQLGMPAHQVQAVGNLKFEVAASVVQQQLGKALKAKLTERLVWVAASTHVAEEEQVLAAFKQILAHIPQCLLILVPRHPDRFKDVAALLTQHNINYITRSSGIACSNDTKILLGDTMGELNIFYAAGDIAFIGGSLVPIGGHNLLEPAALGVPSITGPHVENFKDIAKLLMNIGSLHMVQNSDQLAQQVITWGLDPNLRLGLSTKVQQTIADNSGAAATICQYLEHHKYFLGQVLAKR